MAFLLLKKGDTGENVKVLQTALGVKADGVFGPKTEEAVKTFQKSKGLCVDGLVGNATQKALGIAIKDNSIENLSCEIILAPITRHLTKHSRSVKYIVVHYTAGSSSVGGRAIATRNQFQTSNRNASADFCVDDANIVQCNPNISNYYSWAVGDSDGKYGITNSNSISIEICSTLKKGTSAAMPNHEGWSFSDKALDNTVKLIKYLMAKYNINADHVVRHYDATRKSCPGLVGWNDNKICDAVTGKTTSKLNNSEEWLKFKKRFS